MTPKPLVLGVDPVRMRDRAPLRTLTAVVCGMSMVGLIGLVLVGAMDPGDGRGLARLGALVALSASVSLGALLAMATIVAHGHSDH